MHKDSEDISPNYVGDPATEKEVSFVLQSFGIIAIIVLVLIASAVSPLFHDWLLSALNR